MEINKININNENIIAIGDVHGFFDRLAYDIKSNNIEDTCIIVCGDCGIGFTSPDGTRKMLSKVSRALKKHNDTLILFRGNHDDPSWFYKNTEIIGPHIILVPDYTVINNKILCVGGAISIDRTYRQENYKRRLHFAELNGSSAIVYPSWWDSEAPIFDLEMLNKIKDDGCVIEHVVTHTSPSFCEPLTKDGILGWLRYDLSLSTDIDDERSTMDKIWDKLRSDGHPLKSWTYGHYHYNNFETHEGVTFSLLKGYLTDNNIEKLSYNKIQ